MSKNTKHSGAIARLSNWYTLSNKHGCNLEPPPLDDVRLVLEAVDVAYNTLDAVQVALHSAAEKLLGQAWRDEEGR